MASSNKSQVNDAVEKFARQPAPVKVATFLGLAVFLGLGYWYVFYADMSAEQEVLMTTRRRLADEEKTLQQRKKEYLELIKKKAELEAELAKNAVMLPSSSELPAFFAHLQTQAVAASVRVSKWGRVPEVAVENFVKVPVSMSVTGDYYQLLQYFQLLGETQRIISVEDLSLVSERSEGESVGLIANFTASTFRQADQPPSTNIPKNEQPASKMVKTPPGGRPATAPLTPANAAGGAQQPGAAAPPVRN